MAGVRADWALYVKYTGAGEEIRINADGLDGHDEHHQDPGPGDLVSPG